MDRRPAESVIVTSVVSLFYQGPVNRYYMSLVLLIYFKG